MTSVTFPPHLGGSGITISDDADPITGLLNSGHERLFVPGLQGVVDMAGYVNRYAQAIDGAKDNADRAEDARGYVEAYSHALKKNIRAHYDNLATLKLDFARGRYFADNGDLVDTTNPQDLTTVQRASPKRGYGPTGKFRSVDSDRLLREWQGGYPKGMRLEGTKTNLFTHSENLAQWIVESGIQINKASGVNYFDRISSGSTYVRSSVVSVVPQSAYTVQGVFRPVNARSLLLYFTDQFVTQGTNLRVRFDADTLEAGVVFNADGGEIFDIGLEDIGGGRYYFWVTLKSGLTTIGDFRPLVYASDPGSVSSTAASGRLIGVDWLQFEGGYRSSYIPTVASPVTRPNERVFFSTVNILNEYEGTWLVDFEMNRPADSGAINVLTPATASSNQRLIYRFGSSTFRAFDGDQSVSVQADAGNTGARARVALSIKQGGYRIAANGVVSGIATHNNSFLNPATMASMELAFGALSADYYRFFEILYIPKWLTESQLKELTALPEVN